jgi:hypothetical protein
MKFLAEDAVDPTREEIEELLTSLKVSLREFRVDELVRLRDTYFQEAKTLFHLAIKITVKAYGRADLEFNPLFMIALVQALYDESQETGKRPSIKVWAERLQTLSPPEVVHNRMVQQGVRYLRTGKG